MLGPTFWYVGLIMSQEPCCDFLENSEIMCQLSKNFGNQDNIVDPILRIKQIFKVSSIGQEYVYCCFDKEIWFQKLIYVEI